MHFEEIPVQEDRVRGWAVVYVIVGTIFTIAACVFVVWLFLREDLRGGGRTDIVQPATIPPATVFEGPTPLELERRAESVGLARWQWIDREHGRVLVPVDVAIDLYVKRRQR